MIDSMNDEQKKEYLYNRPNELKTAKIQKCKLRKRVRYKLVSCIAYLERTGKLEFHFFSTVFFMGLMTGILWVQVQGRDKSKPSTSNGILASVWKFHKEEDEELKIGSDV